MANYGNKTRDTVRRRFVRSILSSGILYLFGTIFTLENHILSIQLTIITSTSCITTAASAIRHFYPIRICKTQLDQGTQQISARLQEIELAYQRLATQTYNRLTQKRNSKHQFRNSESTVILQMCRLPDKNSHLAQILQLMLCSKLLKAKF